MSLWKRLFSRNKPLNRSEATGRAERPLVPAPIQRSGNPAAVIASSTPLPRVVPPSAPIGTFPKDLFISYAHKDNARGQVRDLRDAIVSDFRAFAGRDLNVFFDEEDIPTMAAWEQRIHQGLRESRLFLAVFSPNYFASQFCRREWEEFVRYEAIRQCLGEGVAPVYFVELPGTSDGNIGPVLPDWAKSLIQRQYCDLRPWFDAGLKAMEQAHVAASLTMLKSELKERLGRADRAKASPTNVYRHNPQFVGRVRELSLLREALADQCSVGVVGHSSSGGQGAAAVHGVGGMGKTELALAYAHAFAWDYPGGRWLVQCEGVGNFNLVLIRLASPMGIEFTEQEAKSESLGAERVLRELRTRGRSLLVLDNVTDAGIVAPDVLMRLPQQGHVHVLATTRLGPSQIAGSPHDHTFIAVDELPEDDAMALIRAHQPGARFANEAEEVGARAIVRALCGFTLSIETAAVYLGRNAGEEAMTEYLRSLGRDVLAESERAATDPTVAVRHKERTLERTLEITLRTLSGDELRAATIAALLPPDQVALSWVRDVAQTYRGGGATGESEGTEEIDSWWAGVRDSLLGLRLLQGDAGQKVVRMHRMVQEVLKRRDRDRISGCQSVVTNHAKLRADFINTNWIVEDLRWEIEPVLAAAKKWMDDEHEDGVYLANDVFVPLQHLARFAEAELLMRRAVVIAERCYGPRDYRFATTIGNLGSSLEGTNRLAESEPLLRRALAIEESQFGPDHTKVATSLTSLAQLLQKTNRYAEAEAMMRRALAINEAQYGDGSPEVVLEINNLARLLQDTNRLAEAEPLLRRSLAICEAHFRENHPKLALALNNMAVLMKQTGRLKEAHPLAERALNIDKVIYGSSHPDVATDLNNIATALCGEERYSEAEPLLRQALRVSQECYDSEHPRIADGLNNLGMLLIMTNRSAEAEPLLLRALEINEASFGMYGVQVGIILNSLAQCMLGLRRTEEAEAYLRRAIASNDVSCGDDDPHAAFPISILSTMLCESNRLDEAEPLARRVVEIFLKRSASTGHIDPHLGTATRNYAILLEKTGMNKLDANACVFRLFEKLGVSPDTLWKQS